MPSPAQPIRQGQRRVLRLAAAAPGEQSRSRSVTTNFAEFSRRRRPAHPRSAQAAERLPVADHRPQPRRARFAYLGFTGVWYRPDARPGVQRQAKVFTITDRPVYRPEQTVKFKFWIRHAQVRQPDKRVGLRRPRPFTGRDPQSQGREGLHEDADKPTSTAASTANIELPSDATLGNTRYSRRLQYSVDAMAAATSASRNTRSPSSR